MTLNVFLFRLIWSLFKEFFTRITTENHEKIILAKVDFKYFIQVTLQINKILSYCHSFIKKDTYYLSFFISFVYLWNVISIYHCLWGSQIYFNFRLHKIFVFSRVCQKIKPAPKRTYLKITYDYLLSFLFLNLSKLFLIVI